MELVLPDGFCSLLVLGVPLTPFDLVTLDWSLSRLYGLCESRKLGGVCCRLGRVCIIDCSRGNDSIPSFAVTGLQPEYDTRAYDICSSEMSNANVNKIMGLTLLFG